MSRDAASPGPITRSTCFVYGLSGVALGAVNSGLNFFLLLYYDQVLGLKPALAGLALAIALLVDGLTDPLVGILSDRMRSRFGRRHPFLFAAVVPLALAYLALWFPPFDSSQQALLFGYLLGVTILLRVALTLFDVPGNALIAELTRDYESRTRLSTYKVSFTWITTNLTGILMYGIWLRDTGEAGSGLLNAEGFQAGALWFALAAFAAALAVPIGLRRWIPHLRRTGDVVHPPLRLVLRNLVHTYSSRSILVLVASAMFLAAGSGLTNAIWVYLYSYYWNCSSEQVNLVQFTYLFAAIMALVATPRLARGRDKRRLTIQVACLFWLGTATPYALNSVGLLPDMAGPWKMPVLMTHALVDGLLFNALMALLFSLLADVVEESLLRTGRREEGLILASQTLISKSSSALGTWFAAMVLTAVQFPSGLPPGQVPVAVLFDLAVWYVALMWIVGAISVAFLTRYGITRVVHEENVRRLEAR